jgi:sulfite reductase alpha subunit-like flavoprotein
MDFIILYGSQTGNCEQISYELQNYIHENKIQTTIECKTLNEYVENINSNNLKNMIIICSTTGNGDPPDNAYNFWRKIKNRSLKQTFIGTKYLVIGLGDSNYSNFCYMGKMINKRICELGGERINDICIVDEVQDLEEEIEKVFKKIVSSIKSQ